MEKHEATLEAERKSKEGKSDKLVDVEDLRSVKQVSEKTGKVTN